MSSSDYNKIISTINSVSSNYSYTPDTNNLICIDTSNNRIGINTLNPTEAIDISGGNIRAKDFIVSGNIVGNIVPLLDASFNLGSSLKRWGNAYIRDLSVSNIDVSGAIKTYKDEEIYKKFGETITNTTNNSYVGSYITTNYEGNIIAISSNQDFVPSIIRIYKYNDISWVQISQNITPGQAISLNSSGNIIAVGNYRFSSSTGQAQVYRYVNDNSWVKISQDILGLANNNKFGYAISINSAGNIVAIGSIDATTTNGLFSGSISVYKYITDGSWVPLGQTINGEGQNNQAGWSVSLDTSGTKLAIGATGNSNTNGATGQVRVYKFTNDFSWVLISQDIDGTIPTAAFGYSVSLNGDGTLVACGALTIAYSYVKVYKYISDGSWIPQGQTISGEVLSDYFGHSVSLNKQGNILAIGAPNISAPNIGAGRVKVYKYNDVSWIQIARDIDGELINESLGYAVALNGLGNRLVVGVPGGYNLSGYSGFVIAYQSTNLTQTVTSNILPLANNIYTLGSSTLSWSNAYIGKVSVSNISANNTINPNNTNTGTLGDSGYRWNNAWINTIYGSALGSNALRWTNVWVTNINGSTYTGTSDDRVKHNEVIINNGLDVIDQLTPKFYQKTLTMLDASYNGDLSGYAWNYESGLIAQELLQISDLSFVVSGGDYYDSTNNLIKQTYGVNYNSVFVYGLAAIKELHTKVKTQETTILSLQTAMLEQQTTILSLQTAMLEQQTIINNILLAQGQGPHIT